jgi:hypothetical protein
MNTLASCLDTRLYKSGRKIGVASHRRRDSQWRRQCSSSSSSSSGPLPPALSFTIPRVPQNASRSSYLPAHVVAPLRSFRSAIENRRWCRTVRVPRVPRGLSRRSGFRIDLRPAKFNLYCPAYCSSGWSSRAAVLDRHPPIHADPACRFHPSMQIDSGDGKYGINYRWLNFRFSTF